MQSTKDKKQKRIKNIPDFNDQVINLFAQLKIGRA